MGEGNAISVDKKNTYELGVNADLSNALLNIDLNRIGGDLTYLENDGGTLKVSAGSLIEADGSIYAVEGSAETPSGTAENGAYLFFDPDGPSFVWSSSAGDYDPELGGIYDGSGRRQCRFRLKSATAYDILLVPESPDARIEGDINVTGSASIDGGISTGDETLRHKVVNIGDWNMNVDASVRISHGLSDYKKIRSVFAVIRSDTVDGAIYDIYANTGGYIMMDDEDIILSRYSGGSWDDSSFSATSYNRGWVTIWYEV